MPAIFKLGVCSGLKQIVNDNPQLHKNVGDLMFTPKVYLNTIDWSKAKVFVPADPTAVKWIVNDVKEINEFLREKQQTAKIAYLGGNNGKYHKKSLETKLAKLLCIFQGHKLKPFIDGVESEIISEAVNKELQNSMFEQPELEKTSSNSKANWENAVKNGLLNDVKTIVIVCAEEYATRNIGTLKATLKSHNLNPDDYRIVAYPYTATISSDNLRIYQQILGVKLDVPNKDIIGCSKNDFKESAWGLYRVFMELLAIKRWHAKGDVYLSPEQKQLMKEILPELKAKKLLPAIVKSKIVETSIVKKLMGKGNNQRG